MELLVPLIGELVPLPGLQGDDRTRREGVNHTVNLDSEDAADYLEDFPHVVMGMPRGHLAGLEDGTRKLGEVGDLAIL